MHSQQLLLKMSPQIAKVTWQTNKESENYINTFTQEFVDSRVFWLLHSKNISLFSVTFPALRPMRDTV